MVGLPKMLPPSAHGVYSQSTGFVDSAFVNNWIDTLAKKNFPYSGISIPYVAVDS